MNKTTILKEDLLISLFLVKLSIRQINIYTTHLKIFIFVPLFKIITPRYRNTFHKTRQPKNKFMFIIKMRKKT